jgi:hypothetical protein
MIVAGRIPRKLRYAWLRKPPRLPGLTPEVRAALIKEAEESMGSEIASEVAVSLPRNPVLFRTALFEEGKEIMGSEISAKCWAEIYIAMEIYINEMEVGTALLNVADVEKVCGALRGKIRSFRKSYESLVGGGEAGSYAHDLLVKDLDENWWARIAAADQRLSSELDRCKDPSHIHQMKPWDAWIQNVAKSLEQEGFEVSAFSYESRDDKRPPTPFVRLIAVLQAELAEWFGQHEPASAGHPWITLSKAVQRVLQRRG